MSRSRTARRVGPVRALVSLFCFFGLCASGWVMLLPVHDRFCDVFAGQVGCFGYRSFRVDLDYVPVTSWSGCDDIQDALTRRVVAACAVASGCSVSPVHHHALRAPTPTATARAPRARHDPPGHHPHYPYVHATHQLVESRMTVGSPDDRVRRPVDRDGSRARVGFEPTAPTALSVRPRR